MLLGEHSAALHWHTRSIRPRLSRSRLVAASPPTRSRIGFGCGSNMPNPGHIVISVLAEVDPVRSADVRGATLSLNLAIPALSPRRFSPK